MATVLESVVVPRASAITRQASFSINASSSFSCTSASRRSEMLPEFRGLKMKLTSESQFSGSLIRNRSSSKGRSGGIVCEARDTAVDVPEVSEATWKSLVLESDVPVLVEFWAPWCGPCRMLLPIIDELAKQYVGKLKVYKVNTDANGKVANEYGIRSIPTVIIFKDGTKKDAIIGAVPKTTLCASIEKFL